MFSSEQTFTINGEYDLALEKVLNLAMELSNTKAIKAFYKDKKGLVFCSYKCYGSTEYPFEPTIKVLVEQIKQYIDNLSSEEVRLLAGIAPDNDGTVVLGWEVFYPLQKYNLVEKAAMMAVDGKTAADTVPVTRCKDCEHGQYMPSCSMYLCRCTGGKLRYADDYCNYGERRMSDEKI